MINTNNLHIGNLVMVPAGHHYSKNYRNEILKIKDGDKEFLTVTSITNDGVEILTNGETIYKAEVVQPVPLTYDALHRLGFEKNISHVWNDTAGKDFDFLFSEESGVMYLKSGRVDFHMKPGPQYHYVHELQNFYRWFTGKELNISTLKANDFIVNLKAVWKRG